MASDFQKITFNARRWARKEKKKTETEDIKKRWQEYTEELYKKSFTTQIITMV